MKRPKRGCWKVKAVVIGLWIVAGCTGGAAGSPVFPNVSPFETFADKAEYDAYLAAVQVKREQASSEATSDGQGVAASPADEGQGGDQVETNNQFAGVDEGDIIKFAGERLIALRDGHLLVLDIAGERRERPAVLSDTELDADFGTGTWGKGAWYDEMLVFGSEIVLIAYRYHVVIANPMAWEGKEHSGAIELLRYHLEADGTVSLGERVFIESSDYYSGATNYAVRKIGDRLVVYSPFYAVRRYGSAGEGARTEYEIPALLELEEPAQKLFRRGREAYDVTRIHKGSFPHSGFVVHSVYAFSPAEGLGSFDASGIIGDWCRVYAVTGDHFYLSVVRWFDESGRAFDPSNILFQFDIAGAPVLKNAAELAGIIPERFAMDEREGVLRLITEEVQGDGEHIAAKAVSADAGTFEISSSAPADVSPYGVSAVRFAGRHALVSPWELGDGGENLLLAEFTSGQPALSATGVVDSNLLMLEPYGDAKWIGLGIRVDDRDERWSPSYVLDLALLSVGEGGALATAATFTMESDAAWSEAFFNDHAFFFDPARELFGIPYGAWREEEGRWEEGVQYLSMSEEALAAAGSAIVQTGDACEECWYGNTRVVRRGDAYYNLLGRQLKVSALDAATRTMREVASIELFAQEAGESGAAMISVGTVQ